MTRIIQLTGALLGTLIGFALGLALLQRAGDLILPANRPAFLTAFVVATLLFGYLAIPYITIYPVRRAVEASRLGFDRLLTGRARGSSGDGVARGIIVASDIREAIGLALEG